jgi:hypothetical protein
MEQREKSADLGCLTFIQPASAPGAHLFGEAEFPCTFANRRRSGKADMHASLPATAQPASSRAYAWRASDDVFSSRRCGALFAVVVVETPAEGRVCWSSAAVGSGRSDQFDRQEAIGCLLSRDLPPSSPKHAPQRRDVKLWRSKARRLQAGARAAPLALACSGRLLACTRRRWTASMAGEAGRHARASRHQVSGGRC